MTQELFELINATLKQHAKWRRSGLRRMVDMPGTIHDIVLLGDLVESHPGYERLFSLEAQELARHISPGIHIKEDTKLVYLYTVIGNAVEKKFPGSWIKDVPHWRGFKDSQEVKDYARDYTRILLDQLAG